MARNFPGTDGNYLSAPDGGAYNIEGGTLSMHAWVYPGAVGGGVYRTIARKQTGTSGYLFDIDPNAFLRGVIGDGAGLDIATGNVALVTTGWQSAAMVKNGAGTASLLVYLGGTANGQSNGVRGIANSSGIPFTVGADNAGQQTFNGNMAEFAIWNAALTQAEITALAKGFSASLIRPQSLVAYCPLLGRVSPEPSRWRSPAALTVNGTLAYEVHPRILVPRPAIYVP